ncbi:DUF2087 domain-containing protein [Leifsonia sp. ZF2019]|uniref:DUF2087 domain-containing protein n=1 Tax=Leifsonia sp. ZF2019 TaxID=2781978 RepID=UPI001CBA7231|nr:DUF2087 domain-containing protein [Leifsonia sp. ZF2019]UAJ80276.1 DUF2087 domain-containing protein [Leifsonia sp. ZF2019]
MTSVERSDWRPIVAALANADARRLFAEIEVGRTLDEVGSGLSPSRRRRALDGLARAGMIAIDGSSAGVAAERFADILRDAPARPVRTGVDRFLDAQGRIDRYPSGAADRQALLEHVAETVLAPDETVDEAEFSVRLLRFSDDTAGLRRRLVDAALVGRTPSGSSYSRNSM